MSIENNFTDHTVIINNDKGAKVVETTVIEYDNILGSIGIGANSKLTTGDNVQLLILTYPNPCAFHGKVGPIIQNMTTIVLHSGKSKEDRVFERFPIDSVGTIEGVIRENNAMDLPHTKVRLINISQSGMRFRCSSDILQKKDEVLLRLDLNKTEQILTAEIVNTSDVLFEYTEYGCRFLNISHVNTSASRDYI